MSDLNLCIFTGRLGADPEHRTTRNGDPITNFRMAVGKNWKDRDGNKQESTEWVPVTCFNKGLCKLLEYAQKGSRVWVSGRFQTRQWEDQEGNKRYTTEIVIQPYDGNVQIIDGGRQSEDQSNQSSRDEYAKQSGGSSAIAADMDDSIPFAMEWR